MSMRFFLATVLILLTSQGINAFLSVSATKPSIARSEAARTSPAMIDPHEIQLDIELGRIPEEKYWKSAQNAITREPIQPSQGPSLPNGLVAASAILVPMLQQDLSSSDLHTAVGVFALGFVGQQVLNKFRETVEPLMVLKL